MINYLYKYLIDFEVLKILYATKIINYFNKSKFKLMLKNYIYRQYLSNHDEYFNWLSCSIKISHNDIFEEPINMIEYQICIDHFIKFEQFYNKTDHPIIKSPCFDSCQIRKKID